MQRLNRSAQAPLGTAFFLFLFLAVIPVSLKVAGVQMTLSPRLAAAIDAWNQISQVLGASYQQVSEPGSVALESSDVDTVRSSADFAHRESACTRGFEEPVETLPGNPEANAEKVDRPRAACPKAVSRPPQVMKRIELKVLAGATELTAEESALSLEQFGAMKLVKLETLTSRGLLKDVERLGLWQDFGPRAAIKNFSAPMNLELLVRVKRSAPPTAGKAAECKVRAAMAGARRLERAQFTDLPSAAADNSEL